VTTADIEQFWAAARNRKFCLQQCLDCGWWNHPPMPRCRSCRSNRLAWRPVSGKGTVESFTETSVRLLGFGAQSLVFVRVHLREQFGLVHVGRFTHAKDIAPRRELAVVACFDESVDGTTLVNFRPVPVADS